MLQMEKPKCEYAVRVSALQTVSLQDYDLRKDGKIQRVVELTIATTGGNKARFFWEGKPEDQVKLPNEIDAKRKEVQKAMEKVTGIEHKQDAAERVMKDYPATTHSGWAEFKLPNEGEVRDLHRQLMEMWTGQQREK